MTDINTLQLVDIESEKCLLSQALNNNDAFHNVSGMVSADDFYNSMHREIWQAIDFLIGQGMTADISTVYKHLKKYGKELSTLTSVSSANAEYYARIIKKLSQKRQYAALAENILQSIKAGEDPLETGNTIDRTKQEIEKTDSADYLPISKVLQISMQEISADVQAGGADNIYTGFSLLDDITGGFKPSEYIVVGGRAGLGKTVIGSNLAEGIARNKKKVGILSLEMDQAALMKRIICGHSSIKPHQIRTGNIKEFQFQRLSEEVNGLYTLPIFFADKPAMTLQEVKRIVRKLVRSEGVQVIIIDYLGYIRLHGNQPRWEKYSEISADLKALCRELNICIIALSQLGRQAEGKEPSLADLRESGSIEQDADIVMLLNRDRDSEATTLDIKKHRSGGTGKVSMKFIPERMIFVEDYEEARPWEK